MGVVRKTYFEACIVNGFQAADVRWRTVYSAWIIYLGANKHSVNRQKRSVITAPFSTGQCAENIQFFFTFSDRCLYVSNKKYLKSNVIPRNLNCGTTRIRGGRCNLRSRQRCNQTVLVQAGKTINSWAMLTKTTLDNSENIIILKIPKKPMRSSDLHIQLVKETGQ